MCKHRASLRFFSEHRGVSDQSTNDIWVNVGSWTSVLNVSLSTRVSCARWDTEWCGTISNTVGELLTAWSFMVTSESLLVVITINWDVKLVLGIEVFHHIMNVIHTFSTTSHGLGRVVAMATRTIPLREKLWCKRYVDLEVLSDTLDQVAGNPQVVTNVDAFTWTNLILKLTWHDFDICARNIDTCIKTSFVVSISDSATKADVCTNGAVVWTLGTWITIIWPAERLLGEFCRCLNKGVLLLNTIPWLLTLN